MPSTKKKPAGRLALSTILSLGQLVLSGCGSTEPALLTPPPESELYVRLYQLSRAYEAVDLERIASFYADDVRSTTKEGPHRIDVGLGPLRETVGGALGGLRTIKVELTNAVQARFARLSVDTVQGFRADWVTRDGVKGSWSGRHAATWENRHGIWQIVREEFLDLPGEVPREAASFHPIAPIRPTPVERVEEVRTPMGEDSVTVRPEPVRTITPRAEPATAQDRASGPAPPKVLPPAARRTPAPGAAFPAPPKVALFVTPDWTGEPVYVIQFASSKDRPSAQHYAVAMAKETGLPARAAAVDLGERGTWYRTVVGEFRTAEEALGVRALFLAEKRSVGFVFQMIPKG